MLSLLASSGLGWTPLPTPLALSVRPHQQRVAACRFALPTMKVTADDVELAVETAEKLWADALAAREKADALAAEAEELADQSETSTTSASQSLNDSTSATTFKPRC